MIEKISVELLVFSMNNLPLFFVPVVQERA